MERLPAPDLRADDCLQMGKHPVFEVDFHESVVDELAHCRSDPATVLYVHVRRQRGTGNRVTDSASVLAIHPPTPLT
jgi:hypothetical protein